MRSLPPLRPIASLLVVCLAMTMSLVTTPAGAAQSAAFRSGSQTVSAQPDPNATLPNKLIKAVNAQDAVRASKFGKRKARASMLELTGHGATFSRVKGCDRSGPLRASAGMVSVVTCSSKITNAEGAKGGFAFLSYRDKPGAKVFRVVYSS